MKRRGRPVAEIELDKEERKFLEELARRRSAPINEVRRAKAVLMMAEGKANTEIAAGMGFCNATVGTLRKRFLQMRLEGLSDMPRSGPPRTIGDDRLQELIEKTLHSKPKAATHWSTRKMAREMGISRDSVSRIWRAFGLKPHRAQTFQISTDPYYVDKVRDVVGLYMSPPENALVLCVDEKSQIQALERTQPVLALRSGKAEGHTPEYFRHGTVSLFAALDVKKGEVLGKCYRRHRAAEFLAFLKDIEAHVSEEVATGKHVHLVLDNYCTHKSAAVSGGWLNVPIGTCTSLPLMPHGSIRWNAFSPRSLPIPSGGETSQAWLIWLQPYALISTTTMLVPNPSLGPLPLTVSFKGPPIYANYLADRTLERLKKM